MLPSYSHSNALPSIDRARREVLGHERSLSQLFSLDPYLGVDFCSRIADTLAVSDETKGDRMATQGDLQPSGIRLTLVGDCLNYCTLDATEPIKTCCRLIEHRGPGWYSLDDDGVYRFGCAATYSRIRLEGGKARLLQF